MGIFKKKRYYFDYASTTPIDKKVLKVLKKAYGEIWGNPSSLHKEGLLAKKHLEESRKKVSTLMGAKQNEIIFTAGGTESDNLAILGIWNRAVNDGIEKPHIVSSGIEHPAVLEVLNHIKSLGGEVTLIYPEKNGIISPYKLIKELKNNTILVSIMHVNNEVGTVQPIREISQVIKEWKGAQRSEYPYFHSDASQAANYLPVQVESLGVDLMTLDGGKIYGPKWTGCLYVKSGTKIDKIIWGGGQERGLRSGTENVPAIAAFAESLQISQEFRKKETERLVVLRDYFIKEILEKIPGSFLNGDREKRLPNNSNICFSGLDSEFAVIKLDMLGFSLSSSSSCKSLSPDHTSYVVSALNGSECAGSSLRVSFGRGTKRKDINKLIQAIVKTVKNK